MESSVNAHMKNPNFNVGVIVPPDGFSKPVLYSDRQASRDFYLLNRDIYEGKQKAKNLNERKTPKSVLIIFGLGGLTAAALFLKKIFKR